MNIENVIKKIQEQYSKHEDFDEIITDLSDGDHFTLWAERFLEDDFDRNIDLAKSLYT